MLTLLSDASTPLAELLSRKSVPAVRVDRPRPAVLKVTPWIASVDLPVSSKVRLRVSPSSRLTPLNEESCEVVSICFRILLYCVIRPARVAWEFGSATAAGPVVPATAAKALPVAVEVAADGADGGRSRVVGGGDGKDAGRVEGGLQVWLPASAAFSPVQGRDVGAGGSEGDGGCRTAAGGSDGQGLAGKGAGARPNRGRFPWRRRSRAGWRRRS